ncbi:flagellar protein FliS [Dongia sp.]|uniref:flagellar protein FliS n=1 Tax=Dongia sp. TaxID=1977262 RepID=UPI0035B0B8EA
MKHNSGAASRAYRSAHAGSNILDVVISIYEAVIVDLLKARDARSAGCLDQELVCLQRASQRLLGLRGALDSRIEAPLIGSLARFYLTASFQILAIARRKEPLKAAERLIGQMRSMRDAWRDVAGRISAQMQGSTFDSGVVTAVPKDLNVLL